MPFLRDSDLVFLNRQKYVPSRPYSRYHCLLPPSSKQLGRPSFLTNLVSSGSIPASKFALFLASSPFCSRLYLGGGANSTLISGTGVKVPVMDNAGRVCLFSFFLLQRFDGLMNLLARTAAGA